MLSNYEVITHTYAGLYGTQNAHLFHKPSLSTQNLVYQTKDLGLLNQKLDFSNQKPNF